jgi:hypothetical protein
MRPRIDYYVVLGQLGMIVKGDERIALIIVHVPQDLYIKWRLYIDELIDYLKVVPVLSLHLIRCSAIAIQLPTAAEKA